MQRTNISGQRLDWQRGKGMKRGLSIPSVENLQLLPSMLFRWALTPNEPHNPPHGEEPPLCPPQGHQVVFMDSQMSLPQTRGPHYL